MSRVLALHSLLIHLGYKLDVPVMSDCTSGRAGLTLLKALGDRLEMILQPALLNDPNLILTPLQKNLHTATTSDNTGLSLVHMIKLIEKEIGLLLRSVYLLAMPDEEEILCVTIFRPQSYPISCPFDEEIPAVAFSWRLLAPLGVQVGEPLVLIRAYEASDSHWTRAKGTDEDPKLIQWTGFPASCRIHWIGAAWVDPHTHLYPPRTDPLTGSGPAFRPTHYWPFVD